MALPDGSREIGDLPFRYGITLGLGLSSDYSFNVEIQRATTSSTFAQADVITGMSLASFGGQWSDVIPPSTYTYSYRARSILSGWQPSAWTGTVSARPTRIAANMPMPIPAGGQGIGASLFFQRSSATVKVGTDQASSYVTKTVRIHASGGFNGSDIKPQANPSTTTWRITGSFGLEAFGAGTTYGAVAWLPLPVGSEITRIRCNGQRFASTAPRVRVQLFRFNSNSFVSQIVSTAVLNNTTGGAHDGPWSTFSETVTSTRAYVASAFVSIQASSQTSRLLWFEYEYRMPRYDRAI